MVSRPPEHSLDTEPRRATSLWGRVRCMGLPMQTILIGAGALLVLGIATLLGSAVVVNKLKNDLVHEAKEQATLASTAAQAEIERVLAERETTDIHEVLDHPAVRAQLKLVTREGAVVMAAIVCPNGEILLEQHGDEFAARECPNSSGPHHARGAVPGNPDLTWEVSTTANRGEGANVEFVPIRQSGQVLGYLQYDFSDQLALGRVESIGDSITQGLAAMVALVVLMLALTLLLLHRAFRRHLALERRAAEHQHLAHIGTLASGLAHEIRNPLHAMNLHLEVISEELADPAPGNAERSAEVVQTLQRNIAGLNATLTNFMNYALPGRVEREDVRLDSLVQETLALLQPEFQRLGITLTTDIEDGAWISADPTSLRQVLLNVLLNATQILEGSPRREIRVTLQSERQRRVLQVSDTGPGIPTGEEDRIFEAFVSHRRGGSGFGLAIARRIIEDHGGSITACTLPEGGALFTITLENQRPVGSEEPRGGTAPVSAPA